MDVGLITFGTILTDPFTRHRLSQRERLADVVEGAVVAERLGFAWYALGEHHFGERDLISAPQVVLAAIAERTSSITIATATTLVANRDPVLLAEDYATVDLLSDGRLQMIAGASFFDEPYVVFDQAPVSKAARKRENLELLLRLWTEESVSWSGRFRPAVRDLLVQPRLHRPRRPVWVSGGSRPDSVELAVDLGLPMVFGTTGRTPADWAPMFALYRERWAASGRAVADARTGGASHAFVARTSQQARALWREYYGNYFAGAKLPGGVNRPPFDFDALTGAGPALCGSPAEVVDKLGRLHEQWGHDLHLMAVDIGGIPRRQVDETVELIASEVIGQVAGLSAHSTLVTGA